MKKIRERERGRERVPWIDSSLRNTCNILMHITLKERGGGAGGEKKKRFV